MVSSSTTISTPFCYIHSECTILDSQVTTSHLYLTSNSAGSVNCNVRNLVASILTSIECEITFVSCDVCSTLDRYCTAVVWQYISSSFVVEAATIKVHIQNSQVGVVVDKHLNLITCWCQCTILQGNVTTQELEAESLSASRTYGLVNGIGLVVEVDSDVFIDNNTSTNNIIYQCNGCVFVSCSIDSLNERSVFSFTNLSNSRLQPRFNTIDNERTWVWSKNISRFVSTTNDRTCSCCITNSYGTCRSNISKGYGIILLVVPYTGNTTYFLCICRSINRTSKCDVLEVITIVCNTEDTTNILSRTDNLDVRRYVLECVATFTIETDYTTNVCAVCFSVLNWVCLYIRISVYINSDVSPVSISILTTYTTDVSHTVYFNVTCYLDVSIFRCIRSTCNNTYVQAACNLCVVESHILDFAIIGLSEEALVTIATTIYNEVRDCMVSTIEYTVEGNRSPLSISQVNISNQLNSLAGTITNGSKCLGKSKIISIANLSDILDLLAVENNNWCSVYVNNIFHITVNVCTIWYCHVSTLNCVDTILILVGRVNVCYIEGTVIDCSIKVGSNQTVCAVALEGTAVKYATCRRTRHCSPTDDCTILIRKSCTLSDTIEVECINACSLECNLFEYKVTLSISPALCITTLDVDILHGKVLESTSKCSLEHNLAITLDGDASLHWWHSVCTFIYSNYIVSLGSSHSLVERSVTNAIYCSNSLLDIRCIETVCIECNAIRKQNCLFCVAQQCNIRSIGSNSCSNSCMTREKLTLCVCRSSNNLVQVVGTVENNIATANTCTINPKLNLCRHVADRGSCCPLHCPVPVGVWCCIELQVPSHIYITVDDTANVVEACCTHYIAVGIEHLDNEALASVTPYFTPDTICAGVTVEVVTLGNNIEAFGINNTTCIDDVISSIGICLKSITCSGYGKLVACSVRLDVYISTANSVACECNILLSTYTNTCIGQCVACNSYSLHILSILVVGDTALPVDELAVCNRDSKVTYIFTCTLTKDDSSTVECSILTDELAAVNSQVTLWRDCTETIVCHLAHINDKVLYSCISLEAERSLIVIVIYRSCKLDSLAVTVDGYRNQELRACITGIPSIVNCYVWYNFDCTTACSSLECRLESSILGITNLGSSSYNIPYAIVLNCDIVILNILCWVSIEVTAADVQLSLFIFMIIKNPCVHTTTECTTGYIDDSRSNEALFIFIALSSQYIDVAIVANSTVGISNPLTTFDVDSTTGCHSDESTLGTLTITTIYIYSTTTASSYQAAVVAWCTVHVNLSTVVDVNCRSNTLDTEIAVLTCYLSTILYIQHSTTTKFDGRTIGDIIDDVDILGIDCQFICLRWWSTNSTECSSTGINGTILQCNGISLRTTILEVQEVVVYSTILWNCETTEVNCKALVTYIIKTIVPSTRVMCTVSLCKGFICNQSNSTTILYSLNGSDKRLIDSLANFGYLRLVDCSINSCCLCLCIVSRWIGQVDTTVARIACNINNSLVLDCQSLTCLDAETSLCDTLKVNLWFTSYCVVTTEEYATVEVLDSYLRILHPDIVACWCVHTDNVEVESSLVVNNNLRTEQVKVGIVTIETNEVCTSYTSSYQFYTLECQHLILEHPEHCSARLNRRINYNSTVLECCSTKVEVVFFQCKSLTTQINHSSLSDSTLACERRSYVGNQSNCLTLFCCRKCLGKSWILYITNLSLWCTLKSYKAIASRSCDKVCTVSLAYSNCVLVEVDVHILCSTLELELCVECERSTSRNICTSISTNDILLGLAFRRLGSHLTACYIYSDVWSCCNSRKVVRIAGIVVNTNKVWILYVYNATLAISSNSSPTSEVRVLDVNLCSTCWCGNVYCVVAYTWNVHILYISSTSLIDDIDTTLTTISARDGEVLNSHFVSAILIDGTTCSRGQGLTITFEGDSLVESDDFTFLEIVLESNDASFLGAFDSLLKRSEVNVCSVTRCDCECLEDVKFIVLTEVYRSILGIVNKENTIILAISNDNIVVEEVYNTFVHLDRTLHVGWDLICRGVGTTIEVEHWFLIQYTHTIHLGLYSNAIIDGEGITIMANTTRVATELVGTTIKCHLGISLIVNIAIVDNTFYSTLTLDGHLSIVLEDRILCCRCRDVLTVEVKFDFFVNFNWSIQRNLYVSHQSHSWEFCIGHGFL